MRTSRLPSHIAQRLAPFRRELQAEHGRLLIALREARDELVHVNRLVGEQNLLEAILSRQVVLAFEIVIAIAERENFMDMPAERIAVVLSHLEMRLLRLGELLRESQTPATVEPIYPTQFLGQSALAVN